MKDKTIKKMLAKEIIKEYIAFIFIIVLGIMLIYSFIFISLYTAFILVFYIIAVPAYLVIELQNERIFLNIYRLYMSDEEKAFASIEDTIETYESDFSEDSKVRDGKLNPFKDSRYSHIRTKRVTEGYAASEQINTRKFIHKRANRSDIYQNRLSRVARSQAIANVRKVEKKLRALKELTKLFEENLY